MSFCHFTPPVGYEVETREQAFFRRFNNDPRPFFCPLNSSPPEDYEVVPGKPHKKGKRDYKMTTVPRGLVLVVIHDDELDSEDYHFQTPADPYAKRHVDADKIIKLYTDLQFEIYRGIRHHTKTRDVMELLEIFANDPRHAQLDIALAFVFSPEREGLDRFSSDHLRFKFYGVASMYNKPIVLHLITSRCPGCWLKDDEWKKKQDEAEDRATEEYLESLESSEHIGTGCDTPRTTGDFLSIDAGIPAHRTIGTEFYGSRFVDIYVKTYAKYAHCEHDINLLSRVVKLHYDEVRTTAWNVGWARCQFAISSWYTMGSNIYINPITRKTRRPFQKTSDLKRVAVGTVNVAITWVKNQFH